MLFVEHHQIFNDVCSFLSRITFSLPFSDSCIDWKISVDNGRRGIDNLRSKKKRLVY